MPDYTVMPWMDKLRSWIGEMEQTGQPATEFDNFVFSHTDFGSLNGTMKAGCAATACAALEITGYKSPHSAAAISFSEYGSPCALIPGAIVVFQWPSGDHHVTFCDSIVDVNFVQCLGGNQSSEVKDSIYERKYIFHICWPVKTGQS